MGSGKPAEPSFGLTRHRLEKALDGLSTVGSSPPILDYSMQSHLDQQRFVVVYGEEAEAVAEDPTVVILDRADRVVLVETTHQSATQMRRRPDLCVRAYEHENDARRVFDLFWH